MRNKAILLQMDFTRARKWRVAAEAQFFRASYAPMPSSIVEKTNLFKPRMDFQPTLKATPMPWKDIDFSRYPEHYLQCLLTACLGSNVECDFDMDNKVDDIW